MSVTEALGTQKEVSLAQGTISYRERGSGETLLFIHGFLVNGDLWHKVVPVLSQNFHCIVPDLPLGSHVRGCNPEANLTPDGLARLISDFITALDLNDVTLVANDTGGALSQIVITRYPQRIKRLVLTNCDAFENFPPPVFYPLLWTGWIPGGVYIIGQLLRLGLTRKALLSLLAKKAVEPEILDSFLQPLATNSATRYDTAKILRGISNRYTKEAARKFSEFRYPVLLVWGLNDPFFSPRYAERLRLAFTNVQLEYLKDARCFVSEDQPEQLVASIESFMNRDREIAFAKEAP
ncbi:MAG TPA: alpha/beta hydrolase [Chloroflexia bacterium]|nr:alpha/beta hydrolase [Chloroflexia bacterium]